MFTIVETPKINLNVQMEYVSNRRGFVMAVRIVQMVQTRSKSCALDTSMEQIRSSVKNNSYIMTFNIIVMVI